MKKYLSLLFLFFVLGLSLVFAEKNVCAHTYNSNDTCPANSTKKFSDWGITTAQSADVSGNISVGTGSMASGSTVTVSATADNSTCSDVKCLKRSDSKTVTTNWQGSDVTYSFHTLGCSQTDPNCTNWFTIKAHSTATNCPDKSQRAQLANDGTIRTVDLAFTCTALTVTADLTVRQASTGSFSDGPITIPHNTKIDLKWISDNADSCTSTWNTSSNPRGTSGTDSNYGPLSGGTNGQAYTYMISCSKTDVDSVTDLVTVNVSAPSSPTPVSPPTPGTPSCTIAQPSCTGLTCTFNTTYYNGSEALTDYQTFLVPDDTDESTNSDWQTTKTPSHRYEAGTYTAKLKARQNDGSLTTANWCSTSSFTVSSTTTTTTSPTPVADTGSLSCVSCDENTNGNGRWLKVDTPRCQGSARAEHPNTNCSVGCESRAANQQPAVWGNWCYIPQTSFSGSQKYIYGRFIIGPDHSAKTALPDSGDGSIYDTDGNGVYWWNYRSNFYPWQLCQMRAYYRGVELCYQQAAYDMTGRFSSEEAPLHYLGSAGDNVGTKPADSDIPKGYVRLNVWNSGYIPIGYYTYQHVTSTTGEDCRCSASTTPPCTVGRKEHHPSVADACANCNDEGDTYTCEPTYYDFKCVRKPGEYRSLSQTPFTPNTDKNSATNLIADYCPPEDGNARIDIVFITPSILGAIKVDRNTDGDCSDSGDTAYTDTTNPATLALSGNQQSAVTQANSSGGYIFTNLTFDQEYWVTLLAPSGYRARPPNLQSATPTSSQPSQTRDFCIYEFADPWWQTRDADVQANGNINSNIPIQCVQNPNQCTARFDLDGQGGFPGIPAASGRTDFGQGTVSTKGWDVEESGYTGRRYDYDWFYKKAPAEVFTDSQAAITGDSISGDNLRSSSSGLSLNGYRWFYRNGNLTINSTSNLGEERVVLFVNGNLTIQNRITLNDGRGFFLAIANGNINIDPGVSHPNQPALEGLYLSSGTINTGTTGSSNDNRLWIRGALIGWSGINLERNLGTSNNRTNPAEFIEYAPDLIFTFPRDLMREGIIWQEVAP